MTSIRTQGLVIQERDKHLLRELGSMRIVDRDQAMTVGHFGSATRVNVRLLALVRSGFLRRFFLGWGASGRKAIYALSRKGALLVDVPERGPRHRSDSSIAADFFVEHQLAVNDVYLQLKYRDSAGLQIGRWLFFSSPLAGERKLIPDGYFEANLQTDRIACFLEVDLGTERGSVWPKKVENYLHLAISGDFEREFHEHTFRVLVLVESERRLQFVRKLIGAATKKVFWLTTLEAFHQHGLIGARWVRPSGEIQEFTKVLR